MTNPIALIVVEIPQQAMAYYSAQDEGGCARNCNEKQVPGS